MMTVSIIESVHIDTDAENGDYLTVRGRFLMCLLERRIIHPTYNVTAQKAYSNLLYFSYASDTAITHNFAYIYGHGEGAECKNTTYCVSDEPTYLDRYELYVDAKDISEEEQVEGETVPIPEEQYIVLLKTRGSEKLVDPKTTSKSEIAANSTQYAYNRDYYVGDYVTVEHKRFVMIQPKVQLIGMIEAFDQNGRSLTPTFKE